MKLKLLIAQFLICASIFSQNAENVLPIEGNVGIGTDSATCKLDVRGQTRIEGQVLIDGDLVVLDSAVFQSRLHAQDMLVVEGDAEFSQNLKVSNNLEIENDALIQKNLVVQENTELSGEVKLQNLGQFVSSGADTEIIFLQDDGQLKKGNLGDLWTAMSEAPVGIDFCLANNGIPQWWAGTNKLFTPCPDVKVGISTDSPIHKLTVAGGTIYGLRFLGGNIGAPTEAVINAFAQNNTDYLMQLGIKIGGLDELIRFAINNDGAIEAYNNGADNSLTIHNGTGNAIVIYANNNTKILQLEDTGVLRAREVRVNTNTWPDYVFKDDYELMPLNKTEEYINSNGRLPGIPSAIEVIDEGINLGEIQVLQMEKMEEIYLHLIDLDKRVKNLEDENQELKKENLELKNER